MKEKIIIGSLATLFVLQLAFASMFGWYFYNFRKAVEQEKTNLTTELEEEREKPPEVVEVVRKVEVIKEVVREVPAKTNKDYCGQLADSWRLANKTSGNDANRVEGMARAMELKCRYE